MIHVLIERYIAEDMISTYNELARKALQRTYMAPGFISGESFIDSHDPYRRFLMCKWRSPQDWYLWESSDERMDLVSQILTILKEPERVVVMEN